MEPDFSNDAAIAQIIERNVELTEKLERAMEQLAALKVKSARQDAEFRALARQFRETVARQCRAIASLAKEAKLGKAALQPSQACLN
jgi:hypothetical protein